MTSLNTLTKCCKTSALNLSTFSVVPSTVNGNSNNVLFHDYEGFLNC
jgi:hypothetical protein